MSTPSNTGWFTLGALPKRLGSLAKLEKLWLNNNAFTGEGQTTVCCGCRLLVPPTENHASRVGGACVHPQRRFCIFLRHGFTCVPGLSFLSSHKRGHEMHTIPDYWMDCFVRTFPSTLPTVRNVVFSFAPYNYIDRWYPNIPPTCFALERDTVTEQSSHFRS